MMGDAFGLLAIALFAAMFLYLVSSALFGPDWNPTLSNQEGKVRSEGAGPLPDGVGPFERNALRREERTGSVETLPAEPAGREWEEMQGDVDSICCRLDGIMDDMRDLLEDMDSINNRLHRVEGQLNRLDAQSESLYRLINGKKEIVLRRVQVASEAPHKRAAAHARHSVKRMKA